jgi:Fe-S-cluster containining protein
LAVQQEKEEGYAISCKAGCGACCRQLVPISELEAHQLKELVGQMPEPRRTVIRKRFADAIQKFEETGLLEKLRDPDSFVDETVRKLGLDYFHTGVACPFLEDESCSIHPDRPLACREYMVTSPAENCSHPTADSVRQIKIPAKVSNAVIRLSQQREGSRFIPYVPMILALEWAENNPENMPHKPGPAILKEVFENLSGQEIKT